MCYNCGCGLLDEDHGEAKNITNNSFKAMAETNNMSEEEAKMNMFDALRNDLGNVAPEDDILDREEEEEEN